MAQALIAVDTLAQLDVYRVKAKDVGGLILIVEEVKGEQVQNRYLAVQKGSELYRRDATTGQWAKFTRKDVEKGGVQMAKWYFKEDKAAGLERNLAVATTELRYLWNDFLTEVAKRVPPGFAKHVPVKVEGQLPVPTETLERGSKGDQVRWLQSKLKAMGITDYEGKALKVDGDFGKRTEAAVKKLQKSWGLEVTGIVDFETVAALKKLVVGEPPPSQVEASRSANVAIEVTGARMVSWPVKGTDTSIFSGGQKDPYGYVESHQSTVIAADFAFGRRHPAIDLFAPEKTAIYAPVSGTVRAAGWGGKKGGYRVWIEGLDGNWYYMCHMYGNPSDFVQVGGSVTGGVTQLGQVGKTGSARGTCAHVHVEVHAGGRTGKKRDPHDVIGTTY